MAEICHHTFDIDFSVLFQIADYFVCNEIAHNLYMTRGPVFGDTRHSCHRTVRVYFWPRKKVVGMYGVNSKYFDR